MPEIRLNVSNICNFSCKYCHVFNLNKNNLPVMVMPFDLMDSAVESYISLHKDFGESHMNVNFYGGEPLVNFKNIKRLVEKYSNDADIDITWSINTNGSLINDEIAEFLKKYRFDVHLSCDGPKEVHDRNRIDKFGVGTFDRVAKGLALLQKYDVKRQINSNTFALPDDTQELHNLVDLAIFYGVKNIVIDFGCGNLAQTDVVNKFCEIMRYGREQGVNVFGPWSVFTPRMAQKRKMYYEGLRGINVNVNGTFFFNVYPLSKNTSLTIRNMKKIFLSEDYKRFLNSVNNYFIKRCNNCYLCSYCLGWIIISHQFHTLQEEGYQTLCQYTREILSNHEPIS